MRNLPEKVIRKARETGSSHVKNYPKHKDGSPVWVHGEWIYVKDGTGQEHIVKTVKDLNKEKQLEKKLQEKNEAQEKTIKDNETFIFTASHDLTSPVNNIEGLLIALDEALNKPKELKVLIPLLRTSVERLKNKIKELSAIGRTWEEEKKKIPAIDFQKSLDDVLLFLEEDIKNSGAEITSDFSKVPVINFSKKNMKSVLQNLISNAVKYRHADRKSNISVWTEQLED